MTTFWRAHRSGDVRPDFTIPVPEDEAAKATPKLSELIRTEDIRLDMEAARKRTVLGGMASVLSERLGRSHGDVLAALLRRESLGSTSVGDGIAIPHAPLDGACGPAAVLARLQKPIGFGWPDDDPVDLLLALVWPASETKGFLPLLRHTSRLLRRTDLPHLLRKSQTRRDAHAWIKRLEDDHRRAVPQVAEYGWPWKAVGNVAVAGQPG